MTLGARMLAGLSSRRCGAGLKPVGELRTRGTSRSAVSRRLVAGTAAKLAQLCSRHLSEIPLQALFVDATAIGGHTMVVALGVDATRAKHAVGLSRGDHRERRGVPGPPCEPHRARPAH